jgi:hypothetical protein
MLRHPRDLLKGYVDRSSDKIVPKASAASTGVLEWPV